MKILLDEHYTGLKRYLEVLGHDVETVQDANMKGAKDMTVVKYARENNRLLVTADQKASVFAYDMGVRYVWISEEVIAKAIDGEIRNKYHVRTLSK